MTSLVPFNRFTNAPLAMAPDGKLYNLPLNMNTFCRMWGVKTPAEADMKLELQRAEIREQMKIAGVNSPRNLEEQAKLLIGQDVYELFIKGYTEKQWGRPCTELPPFIVRRLPVRLTFDNNYFNDRWQGIPLDGYNVLIDKLLEYAEVRLDTDYFMNREKWDNIADKIVFTGKIDQFYDYRFGKLDYRSLRFETEVLDNPNWQGNAVVNYTSADVPFTRIIEHKHFETFGNAVYDNPKTVVTREYPLEWNESLEPYYPVNDERNQKIYEQYRLLADKDCNVIFGGRLAEYKYYDMAPVIAQVLKYFK